jgi:hypothetical protein
MCIPVGAEGDWAKAKLTEVDEAEEFLKLTVVKALINVRHNDIKTNDSDRVFNATMVTLPKKATYVDSMDGFYRQVTLGS